MSKHIIKYDYRDGAKLAKHEIQTWCGDVLPVESCPCDSDSACWVTRGWYETKLSV